MKAFLFTILLFCSNTFAFTTETMFGELTVDDPMIVELIGSPGFSRLQGIDQSGPVAYYINDFPKYSRYDHSIGVFHLLKLYGASYEEQIAGLLHDASHTSFSHVAEHVFKHNNHNESYQDSIHLEALKKLGITAILSRHNFNIEHADHKGNGYTMLDQKLPDLCADRIEYLLHTGYIFGLLDKNEISKIIDKLEYQDNKWFFTNKAQATKLANLSIHFTEGMYASPWNWSIYDWFAKAINRAFTIKLITEHDFHHATDQEILTKLNSSKDNKIVYYLDRCKNNKESYTVVKIKTENSIKITPKLRAIDPLVQQDQTNIFTRLSTINNLYNTRYYFLKDKLSRGINIARI